MIQIHLHEDPGDVLVFLTGEEEIEDAVRTSATFCHAYCDQHTVNFQRCTEYSGPAAVVCFRRILSLC